MKTTASLSCMPEARKSTISSMQTSSTMKKQCLIYLCLFMNIAWFTSCVQSDPKPANQIVTQDGLQIVLEWRTGSSALQALVDADLDLFLVRGNNKVRRSESTDNFEIVYLEDIFADGEYRVAIETHELLKKTEYTVFVTDIYGDQVISYTSTFNAGENNIGVDFLRIDKRGFTYTISQF